jgi:hypothetical protein
MKWLFILLVCWFPDIATAQQVVQNAIQVAIQAIPCNGASNVAGGTQTFYLENYVDGILPASVYITRTLIWNEPSTTTNGLIDNTTIGNISFFVDPQQSYNIESGFPQRQKVQPKYANVIGLYEAFVGGTRKQELALNPPISYNSGDIIDVAPECFGGGAITYPYIGIYVQGTQDLRLLSPPPYSSLVTFDSSVDNGATGLSTRSVWAGPTTSTTKCRARITALDLQTAPLSTINHMSICLQNGSASSCQATPIELKFGNQSSYSLYPRQRMWSDWTPILVPASSNILITSSMFAVSSNHQFSRSTSGFGSWSSSVDSWNTIAMQGTVFANAGVTNVVDWVQCQ